MTRYSKTARSPLALGGAVALTLACTCGPLSDLAGFANDMQELANEIEEQAPAFATGMAQQPGESPSGPDVLGGTGSFWASSAVASSEYGNPSWAADQATGAPDTMECGDIQTAWASSSGGTEEWLELSYDVPVWVSQVNIVQTYNPNQVVRVELQNSDGQYQTVYEGEPAQESACPFTLEIAVARAEFAADTVVVVIDQSVLGLGWNEIDAVELIGTAGE